jgi:large subunit ribosomal protein L3
VIQGILGRKLGMTRLFDDTGAATATTIVEVGPCFVTQIKTLAKDGYEAVQLGFDQVRPNKLNKPQRGHLKELPALRTLREVPVEDVDGVSVGDRVDASILNPGERVDVVGVSKGKGFAGVMKRHNFRGGPKTHGQSDRWRAPGSIGSGTTPGRVFKGTRMAGHMGNERVTVQNLQVVRIDPERNLVALRGAIPGPRGGLIMIKKKRAGVEL